MSIDFVNRAIQIPSSSGFAVQEILMNSVSLFGRIGRAVGNILTDALPQSLCGPAALLTATSFSIASFIAHYKAHPPQSSDCSMFLLSFMRMISLDLSDEFLPTFFLGSLVQIKTAFTVLPYLNAPFSEPSQFKRVMQGAYTALKYVALTGFAIDVFKNCNRNMYDGFFYATCGSLLFFLQILGLKRCTIQKQILRMSSHNLEKLWVVTLLHIFPLLRLQAG